LAIEQFQSARLVSRIGPILFQLVV
jgi:hypothetical protein